MRAFLVDCENVSLDKFIGWGKFKDSDIFFVVGNATLKFSLATMKFLHKRVVKFYDFNEPSKDYADKIILTLLGGILEKKSIKKCFVVSNDNIFRKLNFTKELYKKKVKIIKFSNEIMPKKSYFIELFEKNEALIRDFCDKANNTAEFHTALQKEFKIHGTTLFHYLKEHYRDEFFDKFKKGRRGLLPHKMLANDGVIEVVDEKMALNSGLNGGDSGALGENFVGENDFAGENGVNLNENLEFENASNAENTKLSGKKSAAKKVRATNGAKNADLKGDLKNGEKKAARGRKFTSKSKRNENLTSEFKPESDFKDDENLSKFGAKNAKKITQNSEFSAEFATEFSADENTGVNFSENSRENLGDENLADNLTNKNAALTNENNAPNNPAAKAKKPQNLVNKFLSSLFKEK